MVKKILLADDSVTIQKVVELTLDEDFELVAVSTGDEALDRLEAVNPDLVIADIHMPGANGYEVCRAVKQFRSNLPVLLLVGTFEPFDEEEAKAAGSERHLKKPFDSQQLLNIAHELLAAVEESSAEAEVISESDLEGDELGSFLTEPVELPDERAIGFGQQEEVAPVFAAEPEIQPDIFPVAEDAEDDVGLGNLVYEDESPLVVDGVELEPADEAEVMAEVEEILADEIAAELAPEEADQIPAISEPIQVAEDVADTFEVIHEREEIETELPAIEAPDPEPSPEPIEASEEVAVTPGRISDEDVDRIAQRVVQLLSKAAIQEICWEVVPDLAEVVIKERIQELESQVES